MNALKYPDIPMILKKEEYLYSILIEIMRTPDFIKKLTQSTVEQFQRRMSLPS